jgi:ATP-dependent HslUV protease subunit HslV
VLRNLEALLLAADATTLLVISGNGEVIDPDDGIAAIGSGGNYALAAARALAINTTLPPREIVAKAIDIAADICVFTNHSIMVEQVGGEANA